MNLEEERKINEKRSNNSRVGNTNAVKYDPEAVARHIRDYCEKAYAEGDIVFLEDIQLHFRRNQKAKKLIPTNNYIYEYAKNNPVVSEALEELKIQQKSALLKRGLLGTYNPTIVKLIASANHGMHEKNNTDITTDGEKIPSFNLAEVIKAANADT